MLAEELTALESKFRSVNPMGGTRLLGDWTVRIDGGPGRWAPAPACCQQLIACLSLLSWPREGHSCFCAVLATERFYSSAEMGRWTAAPARCWQLCACLAQLRRPRQGSGICVLSAAERVPSPAELAQAGGQADKPVIGCVPWLSRPECLGRCGQQE